jgi:1-acyl-sn-glycerol-3-phosphate acyltransferase
MGRSGFVPIRRESPRHSAELFQAMTKVGKVPYSYIIFPEGTRSPDGRLLPFRKGSIGLALRLGLPVVPVSLIDACRANPKGKYRVRPGAVNVVFHTPIEPATDAGSQRDSRDALEERVYGAIYSALPEDQRPAASMELGKKS